jgi:transposase
MCAEQAVNDTIFATLLNLPDITIVHVDIDEQENCLVKAESTKEGTPCHVCGRTIHTPYGHGRALKIRHLSIFGRKTYIVICPPRYQCLDCEGKPTTTQQFSWHEPRSSHTKAYDESLLLLLVNSTVEDVSIKEDVGYESIMGIIDHYILTEVNWKDILRLDVIGIDEISLKKGHKDFVTIVTMRIGNAIRILAVLKDRKKETVKTFFSRIPTRLRKTVRVVCSDMYDGFINAAKEIFSDKVKITIDRFHVAKLYRKGVDTLRKAEMKRLKDTLVKEEYAKLKNVIWIVRKDTNSLLDEEVKILQLLFMYSPLLEKSYKLSKELTDIFNEDMQRSRAKRKIHAWIKHVKKSGLCCFNTFLSTLEERIEEILNYFIHRQTSGFVEGLNNKIKVIKRRCYGILNPDHLFQRILLDLSGYSLFS